MSKKVRKTIICLLIAAVFSSLWACSFRPKPAVSDDGKTLFRIGFSGRPDSLNPYAAGNQEAEAVLSLLYDTLLCADASTGEVGANLCSEYTVSDSAIGGKLWKLTLRDDVFWHDGEKLNADDVEFSLQSEKMFSTLYSYPCCELLDVTGIAVEDDTHLAFIAWGEEEYVLQCLSRIPILPRHVWNGLRGMEFDNSGVAKDPARAANSLYSVFPSAASMVGSGPFVWKSYGDDVCTLTANENYWKPSGRAECVMLCYGVDDPAQMLLENKIDACWDMSLRDWQELSHENGIRVTAGTGGELFYLGFNYGQNSPVQDIRVRKAVEMCTNRPALLLQAFGGGFAEKSYLSPFSRWYYGSSLPTDREYGVSQAAAFLEGCGFRDSDGDGTRELSNKKAQELTLIYSNDEPAWDTAARILAGACASAGIKLELRALSPAGFAYAMETRDYDILLGCIQTWPEPFQPFSSFYWGNGDNAFSAVDKRGRISSMGWNESGYANQDFDAVYEKLLSSADDEALKTMVQKAGAVLYEDAAAVPIGFRVTYQAHSSVWYGIRANRTGGLFFTPATLQQQLLAMHAAGK